MRYADKVDEYLENRPHPIIRHCRLKKGLGENMDNTGIRITSVGKFSVCYYKNGEKQIYNLGFGDDERMPCCSFPDWKMSSYPCKHFFAVFKKFPAWDWNSLSVLYRKSPFLTMDESFETESKTENLKHTGDNAEQVKVTENGAGSTESCVVEELPSRKTAIKSKVDGDTCRKLLRSIVSLTYLLENDVDKVNRMHSVLNELKKEIVFDLPKEGGITLLPAKDNIKIKKEKPYAATETKENFENIPILKRKDGKRK